LQAGRVWGLTQQQLVEQLADRGAGRMATMVCVVCVGVSALVRQLCGVVGGVMRPRPGVYFSVSRRAVRCCRGLYRPVRHRMPKRRPLRQQQRQQRHAHRVAGTGG
jgi:hypothetical protein